VYTPVHTRIHPRIHPGYTPIRYTPHVTGRSGYTQKDAPATVLAFGSWWRSLSYI